jgi:hypothetical protein
MAVAISCHGLCTVAAGTVAAVTVINVILTLGAGNVEKNVQLLDIF